MLALGGPKVYYTYLTLLIQVFHSVHMRSYEHMKHGHKHKYYSGNLTSASTELVFIC